jgi:hypothetical protein
MNRGYSQRHQDRPAPPVHKGVKRDEKALKRKLKREKGKRKKATE